MMPCFIVNNCKLVAFIWYLGFKKYEPDPKLIFDAAMPIV